MEVESVGFEMLVRHPLERLGKLSNIPVRDRPGLGLHLGTVGTWMVFKATRLDEA